MPRDLNERALGEIEQLMNEAVGDGVVDAVRWLVQCDKCGSRLIIEANPEVNAVRLITIASAGWTREEGNDYCPECEQ